MMNSVPTTSETGLLNQSLEYIGDLEELKEKYLCEVRQLSAAWSAKIMEIMDQQGYTPQALAELCDVSRSGVVRWMEGSIPSKRETFIRIGFAAGLDLTDMNKFLQRYGRCNQLYAKSLEDSVFIFVLNSETLPHTYAVCQELLDRIHARFELPKKPPVNSKETGLLSQALLSLETSDELEQFIQENLPDIRGAFAGFYNRVWDHIMALNWECLEHDSTGRRNAFNVKQLADTQNWSASLRRCVSEIRQRKWFPRRAKIISLGLHLNLDREEINDLLGLAHMEPLCAKNPVEGAIMFALMDAGVRELIPAPELRDVSAGLCEYVQEVLEQLNLPDSKELIQDLLVEW